MATFKLDDFTKTKTLIELTSQDENPIYVENIEALISIPITNENIPEIEIFPTEIQNRKLSSRRVWNGKATLKAWGDLEVLKISIMPPSCSFYSHKTELKSDLFFKELCITRKKDSTDTLDESEKGTFHFFLSKNQELDYRDETEIILNCGASAKIKQLELANNHLEHTDSIKITRLVPIIEVEKNIDEFTELETNSIPLDIQSVFDLITLATGQKTICTSWHYSTKELSVTKFFNRSASQNDYFEQLIPSHQIMDFISSRYTKYSTHQYRETLKKAIYGLCMYTKVPLDKKYYSKFSQLESIILFYKNNETDEKIFSNSKWKKVEEELKGYIRETLEVDITQDQKERMIRKITELKRDSIDCVFDRFAQEKGIYTKDIWPFSAKEEGEIGLSQIRNTIAHGDTLPDGYMTNLAIANIHLECLIKRITLALIGHQFQNSNASLNYIGFYESSHPVAECMAKLSKTT